MGDRHRDGSSLDRCDMTESMAFNSRRAPILGRNGMVATSQPLAVAAGLEMLAQGGNAADAAVATAAALAVTEPGSTGLGGDCFALYYEATTQHITAHRLPLLWRAWSPKG